MTKDKLKKHIKKMHTRHILEVSDAKNRADSENYRANIAECQLRALAYENNKLREELESYKLSHAILQPTAPKNPPRINVRAEIGNHPIFIDEVSTRASGDAQSDTSNGHSSEAGHQG
jgi:hypothetical protein